MKKLTKYFIEAWWNGMKMLFMKRKENVFWFCSEVYFNLKENRDGYQEEQKKVALKWLGKEPLIHVLKNETH